MAFPIRTAAAAAASLCVLAATAAAQPLPPGSSAGIGITLIAGFLPDPYTRAVTAGGIHDAQAFDPYCRGFVPQRAPIGLQYTADGRSLYIGAMGQDISVDLTIVVRLPGGAYRCDDDSGPGVSPLLAIESPPSGRYQIWVGRFGVPGETAPANLLISEIRENVAEGSPGVHAPPPQPPSQPANQAPDYTMQPGMGAISLQAGFLPDPHTRPIAAGGDINANVLGGNCVGWIARAPDYRVHWTAGPGGRPLIFSVESSADTTLVINDASGAWRCDDDGGEHGLNPSIRINNPAGGQYDVWVGTYRQGSLEDSTLHVSELYSR